MSAAALPGAKTRVRDVLLTLLGLGLLVVALYFIDGSATTKFKQACTLFAVWGVAAISLNLINGTTGILSLGQHGFMLVGGYTTALLTLPEIRRQQIAESARSQMNDLTLGLSPQPRPQRGWTSRPDDARDILGTFCDRALFGWVGRRNFWPDRWDSQFAFARRLSGDCHLRVW